jgi:hypothetical protein
LNIAKVGAGILIAIGLVMLICFGHQAIQAIRSSSWPTVEGIVTESKTVQRTGRRGRKTDTPSITYRYSVDGIEHVGTRLFFGSQYSESCRCDLDHRNEGVHRPLSAGSLLAGPLRPG